MPPRPCRRPGKVAVVPAVVETPVAERGDGNGADRDVSVIRADWRAGAARWLEARTAQATKDVDRGTRGAGADREACRCVVLGRPSGDRSTRPPVLREEPGVSPFETDETSGHVPDSHRGEAVVRGDDVDDGTPT
jgi:hypothetical protein